MQKASIWHPSNLAFHWDIRSSEFWGYRRKAFQVLSFHQNM
jgi:hypothetical protein